MIKLGWIGLNLLVISFIIAFVGFEIAMKMTFNSNLKRRLEMEILVYSNAGCIFLLKMVGFIIFHI